MNKMGIEAIEIEDADLTFITFTCRDKMYTLQVDLEEYLENSGALECSEDKWSYSSGHYTRDWTMSVSDYLECSSVSELALEYIKDSFGTIDELILKSEIEEC